MRITLATRVTCAHGLRGGMETQTGLLAGGLAVRGHEVTIVTTAHPEGRLEDADGNVRTIYLPGSTWRRYDAGWWEAAWRWIRDGQRPDVLLSESAGALGYLSRTRRELGLPIAVRLHGSAWGELVTAWRGARTPRGLYRLGRAGWRLPKLWARWRREVGAVDRWLAVGPSVARESCRELGIPAERVTVVYNGVDLDRFGPSPEAQRTTRRRLGLAEDTPVALVGCRLEADKGVQVALSAVARLRADGLPLVLLVAGDGRHGRALRRRAAALGLAESVRFHGLVEHDELAALHAAADVFVAPSLAHEGLPASVVEAMASGLPVVASAAGGLADLVADRITGRLVLPGDAVGLATALAEVLRDQPVRRRYGAAARALALEQFDARRTATRVEAVLTELAQMRP